MPFEFGFVLVLEPLVIDLADAESGRSLMVEKIVWKNGLENLELGVSAAKPQKNLRVDS
jgi:hypothetical protein